MKHCLLLFLIIITLIGCSQKVGTKEKITTQNAHLVKDFDDDDIESMVTYYFASRIRKDDKWKEVVPDPSKWSSRMEHSIKEHNNWNFIEFKNLGLHESKYGTSVKVYFKIEVNGKKDGGNDHVEIRKENGRWIISKVPI